MSVVLRCPTCGTTQNHSGECDACSESDVRYFCTNHSPGVWLTDSRCTECGAKFGDAPAVRARPTTPAAPARPRVGPRPESRPAPRRPEPSSPPARPRPKAAEPEDEEAVPSLAEVIVDMLEESRRPSEPVEEPRWREEPVVVARPKPFIAGCLGRLLLLVFLLIALALAGLSTLFGVALY